MRFKLDKLDYIGYQWYNKGGIVLPAVKTFLIENNRIVKNNIDCNIIWSKISITDLKDIYVLSVYRPYENISDWSLYETRNVYKKDKRRQIKKGRKYNTMLSTCT